MPTVTLHCIRILQFSETGQVVLASLHVASWTHAGVHLGLTDNSCRRTHAICTACFVVWRPRSAADTSMNRRHGFLCRRIASVEWVADRTEAAAVQHFSSPGENTSISVCS